MVGCDLTRDDALAEAEARVDHGFVEVVRDGVEREPHARHVALDLTLDQHGNTRLVYVEAMLLLVDDHAFIQRGNEAVAHRRLDAARRDSQDRGVAPGK